MTTLPEMQQQVNAASHHEDALFIDALNEELRRVAVNDVSGGNSPFVWVVLPEEPRRIAVQPIGVAREQGSLAAHKLGDLIRLSRECGDPVGEPLLRYRWTDERYPDGPGGINWATMHPTCAQRYEEPQSHWERDTETQAHSSICGFCGT